MRLGKGERLAEVAFALCAGLWQVVAFRHGAPTYVISSVDQVSRLQVSEALALGVSKGQGLTLMGSALDFACQFLQPCRIGRAGDQSAQLGHNRCGSIFVFHRLRFPRWLYLVNSRPHRPCRTRSAAAE